MHIPPATGRHKAWEQAEDWPHRSASRFIEAAGLRWHVQVFGEEPADAAQKPVLLLIHGTGASAHTWRDMLLPLADRYRVIAPDLPGHGFTSSPRSSELSLSGMAQALTELMQALGADPSLVVGHSAGAAILAEMCLEGRIRPHTLVGLNGALLPLPGFSGLFFSPMAQMMSLTPLMSNVFSWQAGIPGMVEQLIQGTGSQLDAEGVSYYRHLLRDPAHVSATVSMMANWDASGLQRRLPGLLPNLLLVVADNDRTLDPEEAQRVKALLPNTRMLTLPGLGHLAHEERPEETAKLMMAINDHDGI